LDIVEGFETRLEKRKNDRMGRLNCHSPRPQMITARKNCPMDPDVVRSRSWNERNATHPEKKNEYKM